jgi:ribonuclease HI
MKYTIYTDGACSGNPGPGGWGAVIFDSENKQKNISGREENTTNNRMELSAAIMALQEVNTNSEIIIYTDSTYVKNGITEWVLKWKENGWKNSNKESVKNKDLWEKLVNLCEQNTINWKWVKAHASNKYNNLADELATKAIKN